MAVAAHPVTHEGVLMVGLTVHEADDIVVGELLFANLASP
jgi:hypothetical protein